MVTAIKANEVTHDYECPSLYGDERTNTIQRVSTITLDMGPCGTGNRACAYTRLETDATESNFGEQTATRIQIRANLSNLINLGSTCSEFYRIVVHEAGHAFGLADPPANQGDPSVMDVGYITCSPTEYDIAAIKAIYQSRP